VNPTKILVDEERFISYLPLSHVAGLMGDIINNIIAGNVIYYAKPDALSGSLLETLLWCRPTAFVSVPRIWEKFEEKIKEIASQKGKLALSISSWAKKIGTAKT
jgi:long-chain-fatty-acid--CoA ligase ACSBG